MFPLSEDIIKVISGIHEGILRINFSDIYLLSTAK